MKIILDNVTKKYKDKTAVDEIRAELSSGRLIGLIGKNGAGKTTLLKLLATIIKPDKGRILLDDKDIAKNPGAMRSVLGYLPQNVSVYPNLTAFEYLNYIASVKGMNKQTAVNQINRLLSELHLSGVQNQRLGTFSGGMKQRIGLICALLGSPRVIITDEPTQGLDPEERAAVRNLLSRLSKERIVILSTHIVSDLEAAAASILIMKHGNLIFHNTPENLISKAGGYVWEYTLPSLENKCSGISSMVQTRQGIHIRQVSREKPHKSAVPVSSTLEDACLFILEE